MANSSASMISDLLNSTTKYDNNMKNKIMVALKTVLNRFITSLKNSKNRTNFYRNVSNLSTTINRYLFNYNHWMKLIEMDTDGIKISRICKMLDYVVKNMKTIARSQLNQTKKSCEVRPIILWFGESIIKFIDEVNSTYQFCLYRSPLEPEEEAKNYIDKFSKETQDLYLTQWLLSTVIRKFDRVNVRFHIFEDILNLLDHMLADITVLLIEYANSKYYKKTIHENVKLKIGQILLFLESVNFRIRSQRDNLSVLQVEIQLEKLFKRLIMKELETLYHQNLPYKTENKTNLNIQQIIKNSPIKGWQRGCDKFKPGYEFTQSPIKQGEHVLYPINFEEEDEMFSGFVWTLNMNEQHYYNNSLITIAYYSDCSCEKLCKILLNSIQPRTDLLDNWTEVQVLGQGAFGQVLKVVDINTAERFAVKYMSRACNRQMEDQMEMILDYLQERNYLITARKSPFVVQYLKSVKFPNIGGLFLVFEFCIGDLEGVIKKLSKVIDESYYNPTIDLWNGVEDGLSPMLNAVGEKLQINNLEDSLLVYVFEMFSILDFLGRCNVVHCDIKPANIMIAPNFHLKLGDLGLVFNIHFITARSAMYPHSGDTDALNTHIGDKMRGTPFYFDMEQCLTVLEDSEPINFDFIFYHPNNMYDKIMLGSPEFATDMWSMGQTAIEVLLAGCELFGKVGPGILIPLHEVKPSTQYVTCKMTMLAYNYERYINNGLVNFMGEKYRGLGEFFATVFRRRDLRCLKYCYSKPFKTFIKVKSVNAINIKTIEQIESFQRLGINSENVILWKFDESFNRLFQKSNKTTIIVKKNFRDYIKDIIDKDCADFLPLSPAIEINLETLPL